jgi:alkanesulfonate monooxygenase
VEIHWYFAAQDGTHPWSPKGVRVTDYEYMKQLAGATDHCGFAGALIATLPGGTDPWTLAAGLAQHTKQMKFIVAQYAGVIAPLWLAQMAASVDQLSNGRLIINIITGAGATAPQLGITDDHDERYAIADEYWGVFRRLMTGETVDFDGRYVKCSKAKLLLEPVQKPYPELMIGGSSAPGLALAAKHADCWLSLGVPPDVFAEKVKRVKELAADHGRKLRFGIRAYVIVRDTEEEAWAAAQWQYDRMDREAVQRRLAKMTAGYVSEGESLITTKMKPGMELPRDARHFEIYPGLWAGIALIRVGTGTTLVGSPEGIVKLMREYEAAGAEVFILGNYPHIEEAYRFKDLVMPLLKKQVKSGQVTWY